MTRLGLYAAVAATVLLAACTSEPGTPTFGSPLTSKNPAAGITGPGIPTAGRQTAELDLVSGVTTVTIRAADLGLQLLTATSPDGAQSAPDTQVDGDTVRVSMRGTGGHGAAAVHIDLNSAVAWTIKLDGGATEERLDLTGGKLAGLDFGAGATRIEATLPAPAGSVPVRMMGGASTFDLHLPSGVPAQVRLAGGAGQATIDGVTHTGISGETVFATPDWSGATDGYAVDAVAGVSALTLDRKG